MKIINGLVCVALGALGIVPLSGGPVSICSTIAVNLVANCGFETGDFTSWTLSGNDVPLDLGNLYGVEGKDPVDSISPNSGSEQAYFADLAANATTLSQTINTTAGVAYTISWYLAQDTPAGTSPSETNRFSSSFNGSLVSLTAVPVEGYTFYSYTGTAGSSSTVLRFSLGNDLGQFLLDDISVVSVVAPEPSTWALLGAGLLGMAYAARRQSAGQPRVGEKNG